MESSKRIAMFENEISNIKNSAIRDIVTHMLTVIPDYFYYIPASSSGRYHPDFALGEGGLVRHVRAAVKIAKDLSILEMEDMNDMEMDIAYAALILHDCYKAGDPDGDYDPRFRYMTVTEHPVLMYNKLLAEYPGNLDARAIAEAILTHMGQWNTKYKSTETFAPKPETKIQKFVHLCDFLSSRKNLEIILD